MALINLFFLPGFQGIVPIFHRGVQIFKFLPTCQKLPPKVDLIFSAFFDNYCKNSPKKSAIIFFGCKCFPLRSDVFFEQKIWLFSKVGVFWFLPPLPYLCRFWTLAHKILVSCSPARVLSKSVEICGPKFISFDKVGVFRFLHPYHGFAQKCALLSPRDAPDFWCLTLKLPYSTPIMLSVKNVVSFFSLTQKML